MKNSIRVACFSVGVVLAIMMSCQKLKPVQEALTTDTVSMAREVWSKEQANEWYRQWGWLRGADFIPSSAINQLEMWQAETFDHIVRSEAQFEHFRRYIAGNPGKAGLKEGFVLGQADEVLKK